MLENVKLDSSCSRHFFHYTVVEQLKIKHHVDNASAGFTLHPFVIDTGDIGPRADKVTKFINEIS